MGRTAKNSVNTDLDQQLNQRYHLNVAGINTFVQTSFKGAPQRVTDDVAFKNSTFKLKYPPYVPQVGDQVILIKKGYSNYIKHLRRYKYDKKLILPQLKNGWPQRTQEGGPKKPKSMLCFLRDITYRLVNLRDGKVPLTVIELHFSEVKDPNFTFVLDYVDLIEPMDDQFMIEKHRFDAAMKYLKTVKVTRYISYPHVTQKRLIHGHISSINSSYSDDYYENMHSHWKGITANWLNQDEQMQDPPDFISLWDIKQISTLKIYKDNYRTMDSEFESTMHNKLNEFTNVPGFFQLPYLNHVSPYPAFFGLILFRLELQYYRQTQALYHDFTHIFACILHKIQKDPQFQQVIEEMHKICQMMENQMRVDINNGICEKLNYPPALWTCLANPKYAAPSAFGYMMANGLVKVNSSSSKPQRKVAKRKMEPEADEEPLPSNLLIPQQRYLFEGVGRTSPSPHTTAISTTQTRQETPPNNLQPLKDPFLNSKTDKTKDNYALFFLEVPPTIYVDRNYFQQCGTVNGPDGQHQIFLSEHRSDLPPIPKFPHALTHLSLHLCSIRNGDSDYSLEPNFRQVCRMQVETRLSAPQRSDIAALTSLYEGSLMKVDQNHAMMLDDDDNMFTDAPELYANDRLLVEQYRPFLNLPHLQFSKAGFFYSIMHRQIQVHDNTVNACSVHLIGISQTTRIHIDDIKSFII